VSRLSATVEPVEVCLGGCFSDDQCSVSCDDDLKLCTQSPEICDSGFDEDLDGLHDCAELDCITLPGCVDAIDDACAGATPLAFDTPTSGSTFGGSDVFGGVCAESGGSFTTGGGAERLYTVTAPAKGELTVTATPAMGDLGIYARTVCTAASAQVACSDDAFNPAATESFTVLLDAGTEVTIFVDAYGIITAGDFELLATFEPEVCGDGLITGDEQCDDAGTTSGDGCSATCAVRAGGLLRERRDRGHHGRGPGKRRQLGWHARLRRLVRRRGQRDRLPLRPRGRRHGDHHLAALRSLVPTACSTRAPRAPDDDLAAELDCADLPVGGEELEVAVTDGEPIFIFVDSYTPTTTGPYTLVVTQ
jgi:cysteine-rich repeat protein